MKHTSKKVEREKRLFKAIEEKKLKDVKKLIKKKKVNVNCKLNFDITPVFLCLEKGNLEILQFLVEKGKANLTIRNNLVIHQAAFYNTKGLTYMLEHLEKNAEIKLSVNDRNNYNGFTPVHESCLNGKLESVKVLKKFGANFELKTFDNETCEDLASINRNYDILKYVIQLKIEKKYEKKEEEWNMLKVEYKKHVQMLIENENKLKNLIKDQKDINILINNLEKLKKTEVEHKKRIVEYETSLQNKSNLDFLFEKYKMTIRYVKEEQKKSLSVEEGKERFNKFKEINLKREEILETKKLIKEKLIDLEEKKKGFEKFDNEMTFLSSIFELNSLALQNEEKADSYLKEYEDLKKMKVDKEANMKKIKLQHQLMKLEEGTDPKKLKEMEKEYKRESQKVENLNRKIEKLKNSVFLLEESISRTKFLDNITEELIKDYPDCIKDSQELLNLFVNCDLSVYSDVKEVKKSSIYHAKIGNKKVQLRRVSLEKFLRMKQFLLIIVKLQKQCPNILPINKIFIASEKILTKEFVIFFESNLLTSHLNDKYKLLGKNFVSKTEIKEIFRVIFKTLDFVHSEKCVLKKFDSKKVMFDENDQIFFDLLENVEKQSTNSKKVESNIKSLSNELFRFLSDEEILSSPAIEICKDLTDYEKKFFQSLLKGRKLKNKFSKGFFDVQKNVNIDRKKVTFTIKSLKRDTKDCLEFEIENNIVKFLDLFTQINCLDDLLKKIKINGKSGETVYDGLVKQMFSVDSKLFDKGENKSLYLPADREHFPNIFHNLGKFVLKLFLEEIKLKQFSKFHSLIFLVLSNDKYNSLHDYLQFFKEFAPEKEKFYSNLTFLSDDQIVNLSLVYNGVQIKKKKQLKKYIKEKLKSLLFGKLHRKLNLLAIRKGFYSCLKNTERNLIKTLNLLEIKDVLCEKEVNVIQFISSFEHMSCRKLLNYHKGFVSIKKKSNSYYKLVDMIEKKEKNNLELLLDSLIGESNTSEIVDLFFECVDFVQDNFNISKNIMESYKEKNDKQIIKQILMNNKLIIRKFLVRIIKKFTEKEGRKIVNEFKAEMFMFIRVFCSKFDFDINKFTLLDESLFMNTHVSLWKFLKTEFYHKNKKVMDLKRKFDAKTEMFNTKKITLKHLQVEKKFRLNEKKNAYQLVIKKLISLKKSKSIRRMLMGIKESLELVIEEYKRYNEENNIKEDSPSINSLDTILPVFIYCCIKANKEKHVFLTFQVLKDFIKSDSGVLYYSLVNLESAIFIIMENLKWENLSDDLLYQESKEEKKVDIVEELNI